MTDPEERAEDFWSGWMILISIMAIVVGAMVFTAHGPRGELVSSGIIIGGIMIMVGLTYLVFRLINWLWTEYL